MIAEDCVDVDDDEVTERVGRRPPSPGRLGGGGRGGRGSAGTVLLRWRGNFWFCKIGSDASRGGGGTGGVMTGFDMTSP